MSGTKPLPLVAGNWKMNGRKGSLAVLREVIHGTDAGLRSKVDLLVCPPATLIAEFAAAAAGSPVAIGAQDCHPKSSGAHTGDISAEMVVDAGASAVIVGHSERRADHGETDALVRAKAEAVLAAGAAVIVCVGETRAEREQGRAVEVVTGQLHGSVPPSAPAEKLVVAYEPVWAIGTGLVPTVEDVADMHAAIRRELGAILGPEPAALTRILYGGSVKPSNAAELLAVPNVDGALVGGASLVATDFLGIAAAYIDD